MMEKVKIIHDCDSGMFVCGFIKTMNVKNEYILSKI